ncbi:protein dehydratase [Amycolatopsis sp. K13G38]|uniref:Protein dehydratase n=2 Tax=Amycolatopsis acididurans TaxID=2724524 RepID=A0ABX1JBT8_9PSEU|nr:protein dehydratase [Amycolatopsis acididurans]
MKTMAALLADPNPIHFDVSAVEALGMGDRPVNQGPSNMGYVLNMLAAWAGCTTAVERLAVRFRANVLAGDRVVARGVVTGLHGDGPDLVAECDVRLDIVRPDGDTAALTGTARVRLAADVAGA